MRHVVSISDAKVSGKAGDVLVTHSLGSCIGVALCDEVAGVAGLLHFQLPDCHMDIGRANQRPLMFADSGLDWLLKQAMTLGLQRRRATIRIAGGAQMFGSGGFDIGGRNLIAIRRAAMQRGLPICAEDVGGTLPRTMLVDVATGRVRLRLGALSTAL